MTTPNEVLRNPLHTGPGATRVGDFAGRTTIDSGSTTVTVSTATVKSDSIITFATEVGTFGVSSGAVLAIAPPTEGVSFVIGRHSGIAVAWDETVMWRLTQTT